MAIHFTFYGDEPGADEYFTNRLHSCSWFNAKPLDRRKALVGAGRIIDTLNYNGCKNVVFVAREADPDLTDAAANALSLTQDHEFPRGSDTDIPDDIVMGAYEIAFSLLDGKDPEMELEALGISSQGLESVRTTYARTQVPIEHIINGVPNAMAWRLIRPYLFDGDSFIMDRV